MVSVDLRTDRNSEVVAHSRLVVVGCLRVVHAHRILTSWRIWILTALLLRWRRRIVCIGIGKLPTWALAALWLVELTCVNLTYL